MKSPIASFSTARSSGRSDSAGGIGGCDGPRTPPPRRPSRAAGPRSKIEPWPICASSCGFWPADWACSSTASIPCAEAPVEPNAPHLMSASIACLFTARVNAVAEVPDRIEGPALLARAPLSPRPPEADALDGVEAEADVAVVADELVV